MLPDRSRPLGNPNVLLIVLVVLSFVLMTFDIRSQGEGVAASLRSGAQSLAAPLQDVSRAVVNPVVDLVDGIVNLSGLREENQRLRADLEELRASVADAEALRRDNELLRQFLNLSDRDIPTVVAEVRGGTGPLDAGFVIDAGLEQGVVVGNPVVNQNDVLVGLVQEAFPNSASVVPVVSPAQGIEVITAAGDLGVIQGLGSADSVELLLLDAEGLVEAGEILRTSGGQRGVPAGLAVAEALELSAPEGGLVRTSAVRPLVDPATLEFVLVLQFSAEPIAEEPEADEETGDDPSVTDTTTPADESGEG